MYFLLHPGGAVIEGVNTRGIRTLYPNTDHQPPGSRQLLWFYDPHESGWMVYGDGQVSRDGTLIEPDAVRLTVYIDPRKGGRPVEKRKRTRRPVLSAARR